MKRLIGFILAALALNCGTFVRSTALPQSDTSLTARVARLGNQGSLNVDVLETLSADLVIPPNVTVTLSGTGQINCNGHNLRINGAFQAPLRQVFTGKGSVSFGQGAIKEVYLEWWGGQGDNNVDNANAFASAYGSIKAGALRLLSGQYKTSASLVPKSETSIIGSGITATEINYTGASFWIDYNSREHAEDFMLEGMTIRTTSSGRGGVRIGNTNVKVHPYSDGSFRDRFVFRDLRIMGPNPLLKDTVGMSLTQVGEGRLDHITIGGFETDLIMDRTTANLLSRIRVNSFRRGIDWLSQDAPGTLNDHAVWLDVLGPSYGNDKDDRGPGYGIKFDAQNVSIDGALFECNPPANVTAKSFVWFTANGRLVKIANAHFAYSSGGGVMQHTMVFDPNHGANIITSCTAGGPGYPSILIGPPFSPGNNRVSFVGCHPSISDLINNPPAQQYATVLGEDSNGSPAQRATGISPKFCYTTTVCDFSGVGSPEGVLSADIGSTYRRRDAPDQANIFYVKASGNGTARGWIAK